MICLNDIVEVFDFSMKYTFVEQTFFLKFFDSTAIAGSLICIDRGVTGLPRPV